ncbi:hypothetical protein [Cohnella sp. GbtcB17]|uniref:hypothetical protein n=1 Tax=Cohnella sp. GbtcB17 TaxID=2824762 RepID=UPI0020C60542|nr:hypothetical protein [Cohnella sp. GbtcB17]
MRFKKEMYVLAMLFLTLALFGRSAYASWAYSFVVYHGNIYVVTDERIKPSQVGEKIGKVTKYSDHEGTYSGHFSNRYPKGTKYYRINGVQIRDAIAVREAGDVYVKATYGGEYAGGKNRVAYGWLIAIFGLFVLALVDYYRRKNSVKSIK